MENDVKKEIDSVKEKIDRYADKRYNDVKTIASIALTAISVFIIAFTIISGLSLKSERESLDKAKVDIKDDTDKRLNSTKDDLKDFTGKLRGDTNERLNFERENLNEFKKELKESNKDLQLKVESALGKVIRKPEIILISEMDKPLEGQKLNAKLISNDTIEYRLTLKNIGTAPTDPMYIKMYFCKPLDTGINSTDEKDFDYETVISPEDMKSFRAVLPSQMSAQIKGSQTFKVPLVGIENIFPMLIKVYYGGDHATVARFMMKVSR
jgi:hypothetical protein